MMSKQLGKYRTCYDVCMKVLEKCIEPSRLNPVIQTVFSGNNRYRKNIFSILLEKGFLKVVPERKTKRKHYKTEYGRFYQTSPSGTKLLKTWKEFQKVWNHAELKENQA